MFLGLIPGIMSGMQLARRTLLCPTQFIVTSFTKWMYTKYKRVEDSFFLQPERFQRMYGLSMSQPNLPAAVNVTALSGALLKRSRIPSNRSEAHASYTAIHC